MLKRFVSMIVGIAILAAVMLFNNTFIFTLAVTVVAMIGLYEFYRALKQKDFHPVGWVGYISTLLLLAIPYVGMDLLRAGLTIIMPIALLVLFSVSICSKMKINVADIAATILGMVYVPYLFAFVIFMNGMANGSYYIWYILG